MKPRILVCGDALYSVTGLAYVAGYMTKIFVESGEFESIAYFCLTGNVYDSPEAKKIRAIDEVDVLDDVILYNTNIQQVARDFDKAIKNFKPHIVISIADPWITECIAYSQYKASYHWIAYTTVEVPKYSNRIFNPSTVFPKQNFKNILENLVLADCVISVTKQGIESLKNIRHPNIKLKNIYPENIYNGVEINKRSQDTTSKSDLFKGYCTDDTFIFMTLGMNAERKKLEQSILAFSKFIKKIDNPKKYKLYIHTNANASVGGPDLAEVAHDEKCIQYLIGNTATTALPKKEIYKYYNICDCYIGFPGGEGFGYGFCFPSGTSILTKEGLKNIENININDEIVSHTGKFQKVTGNTKRFSSSFHIIKSLATLPLTVTDGHRIFSVKNNKRFTYLTEKDLNPSWNSVDSLEKNDLIAVPKIKGKVEKINKIKITDYVFDIEKKDDLIFYNMSRKSNGEYSLKSISKKFNCSFQTIHKAINNKLNSELGNDIRKYCKEINYKIPEPIKCKNTIELTENIMEYFGLYIAEGSSSKNSIEFSLHQNEIEYQELIKKVSKNLFGDAEVNIKNKKNSKSCSIIVSSKIAANLMSSLFGKGALNKKIPYNFYNSDNIGYLIKGYFEGDGCLRGNITAKTISKRLSFDLFKILNMKDIFLSIHKKEKESNYGKKIQNKNNLIIGKHDQYILHIYEQYIDAFLKLTTLKIINKHKRITNRNQTYIKTTKDYFFIPINDISKKKKVISIPVYNLHVNNDESYLAEGYAVHNCEAMLHEKPLVYIDYGGHSEYAHVGGLPAKVKHYMYAVRMGMKWGIVDTDSASAQMVKLAKNSHMRQTLGKAGYEFVKENFSWDIIKEKLMKAVFTSFNNSPFKTLYGKDIKRII